MELKISFWILILGLLIIPAIMFIAGSFTVAGYWESLPLLLEYFPAFIATLLGVYIGISLESWYREGERSDRAKDINLILMDEIERMIAYLEPAKGNFLQTQVWDALISSGEISLIDTKLQRRLFEIYDTVKNLNIDLKREEQAEQAYLSDEKDISKQDHHDRLDKKNRLKEHNLKAKLTVIREEFPDGNEK